jgi:prepilin-type N-terminal cleavage/methylation domain-containing protein
MRRGARRRRAGFTLVEVIVVLVILAILAAIAIPALTGYIDRAQWTEKEADLRNITTAAQTMIIEEMTANGGNIVEYDNKNDPAPQGSFDVVAEVSTSAIVGVTEKLYSFNIIAPTNGSYRGLSDLVKLTADSGIGDGISYFSFVTGSNGAIKRTQLTYPNHFGTGTYLYADWLADLPDTDSWMQWYNYQKTNGSAVDKVVSATITPGFSFYKRNGATVERVK